MQWGSDCSFRGILLVRHLGVSAKIRQLLQFRCQQIQGKIPIREVILGPNESK